MPMDIRAYFSKTPESKSSTPKPSENGSTKTKKSRKRVFIDSDDEVDPPKLAKSVKKGSNSTKKTKSEEINKSHYFEVSKKEVGDLFGKGPVKRVEQPKITKIECKKKTSPEFIDDIDWEDDFALAETSALEKSPVTFKSPEGSIAPVIEKASPKKDTPHKNITPEKIDLVDTPSKNNTLKAHYSPPKNGLRSTLFAKTEDEGKILAKNSETNGKEQAAVSRDHEMSPSPEPDDTPSSPAKTLTVVSSLKKRNKNDCVTDKNKSSTPNFKNLDLRKPSSGKNEEQPNSKKSKVSPDKKFTPKPTLQKSEVDGSCMLWVEKYKPVNLKQIIGQQGVKSNVNKLLKWLKNWFSNHSGNKKLTRPGPWAKDDSGAYFKAALLSGPPGLGKTTTAHLVCKELGMDVVEFNASDTRSKRLLKEEISDLLKSKSLSAFAAGDGKGVSHAHVLVMDEVDGMAGNEDRGGVQELIQLIKTSKVPVICMCNDRNHPKIRSLANYCFDLRFSKPRAEQIKGAMMSVCFKEGLKIKPEVLTDVIVNTNQDIRLILNHLSILAAQNNTTLPSASKYVKIGPWDVVRKVFSEQEHKNMSIFDKCDLFFYDYNIAPLFVQENYLNVQPHSEESKTKLGKMELFAKAATSIAYGDMIEKAIRSQSAWSLLPVQAVFSSFIPGEYLVGHVGGQINFPAWLGKNSRRGKLDRMAQELQAHTRLRVSGSKETMAMDYGKVLKDQIVRPLTDKGVDGVEDSLSLLKEYSLLREDLDSLVEITSWPNQPDPFSKLESRVKSAFTRAYNKNPVITPFSISGTIKKGRAATEEPLEYGEDDGLEDDDEENQDDISKDGMIMIVKKRGDNKKEEAGSSGKGSKRGGGGVGGGKRGKK